MITENFDLKSWAKDVNERLLKLEQSHIATTLSTPVGQLTETNNTISISDFIKSYPIKSLLEKALIFSYYIEKIQNITPFDLHDIKQSFINARESLPDNPSDLMYQAVKKNYLMKVNKGNKNKGFRFQITNNGLKFIESLKATETVLN